MLLPISCCFHCQYTLSTAPRTVSILHPDLNGVDRSLTRLDCSPRRKDYGNGFDHVHGEPGDIEDQLMIRTSFIPGT